MVRKYIHIFALLVVTILSYALVNSATVLADGEKWTLTDKTTVKVTGGALGSTTVTLKPNNGDGRSDPSVWTETGSKSAFFTSGTDKICARVNGLTDIDANRSKTGSIDLVDPGWCSDPIAPGGGGVRGPTGSTGLSTKATLTSTIATAPLKCGDAGFMGPCAEPFDPATTDCSTIADTTARTRCESIQICINIGGGKADECTSGWDACMATYDGADEGAKGAGIAKCADGVKEKDFEVGKYKETEGEDTSSCEVEGVGWIICPVMNFIGMITDASYIAVASLLDTPASMFDTSRTEGQATQSAWGIMRNIANVAFVIAFMVIIYSQLTSMGVSNYGVKKLLPKLIIAAILVNMSFIVSALAVDLSNIVGHSTKQLFDGFADSITVKSPDGGVVELDGSNIWMNLVGGLLGGTLIVGTSLYAGLSVLLPMLIGALAAVVTVVIVLTLRQALIVLLVVISPLAFVALLLPNTENWFKKWRSIFFVMLIMFPVVAAVFGASAFAGKIIMLSSDNMFVQIMGAGITIIPLFITPVIMKAAGGVLNRFAGIVNNTDKGMFDRMRKGADSVRNRRQNNRSSNAMSGNKRVFGGGQFRRKARRDLKNEAAENAAKAATAGFSVTDPTAARYANSSAQSQLATSAVSAARNNSITSGIADGTINPGEALGVASMDPEIVRALAQQQAKAISDVLSSSLRSLAQEVADVKAKGGGSDEFLRARALNIQTTSTGAIPRDVNGNEIHVKGNKTEAEQTAALHQLASTGRDGVLRKLQQDPSVDQTALQEAIGSNAGSLIAKAPDLVKGQMGAFSSVNGAQMSKFSPGTAEAQMSYMVDLHSKSINPSLSAAEQQSHKLALDKAVKEFNSAVEDITQDSSLQGDFSGDAGAKILHAVSSNPQFQSFANTNMTGLAAIDVKSGKIR